MKKKKPASKTKKPTSKTKLQKQAIKKSFENSAQGKIGRKRFAIKTAQKIKSKIREIIQTVEGVQPSDLRLLALRILERAQTVSEGLKSKK